MIARNAFLGILLLGSLALASLLLGTEIATPAELFRALADPTDPFAVLIRDWRLPRVLAAFLVGACLAMSGAIFQGVFKNPLAEPYLLGSASGAAVGASIALLVPLPASQSIALPFLAFLAPGGRPGWSSPSLGRQGQGTRQVSFWPGSPSPRSSAPSAASLCSPSRTTR